MTICSVISLINLLDRPLIPIPGGGRCGNDVRHCTPQYETYDHDAAEPNNTQITVESSGAPAMARWLNLVYK